MGYEATGWAWSQDDVTPTEKLVLLALADHINKDTDSCWPKISTIMKMTGLKSNAYCRDVINSLVKKNKIVKSKRMKGGVRTSNLYKLNYDAVLYLSANEGTAGIQAHPPAAIPAHPSASIQAGIELKDMNQNKELKDAGQKPVPSIIPEDKMKSGAKGGPKKGNQKMSAAEVQKQVGVKQEPVTHDYLIEAFVAKKLTAAVMAQFWRQLIPMHHPEYGPISEFKSKELGHLVQLRKYLGGDTVPALACVVKNWIDFIKYAEENFGAFKSPMLPMLPYLVMQSQAIISYKAMKDKGPSVQSIAKVNLKDDNIVKGDKKPIVKVAPKVVEKDKPMTLAEFLEMEMETEHEEG